MDNSGDPRGYRIGWPEEDTAWKVLEFEYVELENEHILEDIAAFLGMGVAYKELSWRSTLAEFRRRYGYQRGIWLCRRRADALLYYGKYYGEGAWVLEYDYHPKNIVSDLGPDGIFVLDPKFVREGPPDPLYPLKRDLARVKRLLDKRGRFLPFA